MIVYKIYLCKDIQIPDMHIDQIMQLIISLLLKVRIYISCHQNTITTCTTSPINIILIDYNPVYTSKKPIKNIFKKSRLFAISTFYYNHHIIHSILIDFNIKMHCNEQQTRKDFLIPSSIPRILQSNRQSCALQTDRSISTLKTSCVSPKHKQNLTEYTFEPRVNSSHKKPRSIQKFVQDQEKYQQEKQRKLTEMREEVTRWEDEQIRGIPQINSISRGQLSISGESVFERLSKQKPLRQIMNQSQCFSPSILPRSKQLQRDKQATDLLYQDAKKRLSRQKFVVETEKTKASALASPKINSNTNELVRKKILAEFMNLITDESMNPLLALSVIQEIFNIKLRDLSSPPIRRIVQLIANQHGEVLTEKLWSFIAVIIGDGEGCFPTQDEQFIKKNYSYFYKERINKDKKRATPQVPTFQPKILQKSCVLADKHREKLCRRASEYIANENPRLNLEQQTIALEDLFIIQHMQRIKQNQRLKMQKENQELQQCTFKPTITSNKPLSKPKQKIILRRPLRQRKHENQLKTNQVTARPNQSAKKLTSVQPSLEQSQRLIVSQQKKADILKRNRQSIDNLSIRMMQGRTTRELQRKMTKRGYSKNESWMQEKMRSYRLIVQNNKLIKGLREY